MLQEEAEETTSQKGVSPVIEATFPAVVAVSQVVEEVDSQAVEAAVEDVDSVFSQTDDL